MNPWIPISSPIDLKHLGKLGEECGELSAAISRCIIQGLDGREPITGKLNKLWLEDELADVLANIRLNIHHFKLNVAYIEDRAAGKMTNLLVWHGMLEDEPK